MVDEGDKIRKRGWLEWSEADGNPGKSHKSEGGLSSLLFDPDKKGVQGQAEFIPDDEDQETSSDHSSTEPVRWSPAFFFESTSADVSEDEDGEDGSFGLSAGAVLAGLGLIGLTVGAVAAVVSSSRSRRESRRELEWRIAEARQDGSQAPVAGRRVAAPAGWYDDDSGQLRWWDGQEWTQQYYTAAPPVAAPAGWYDDGSGRLRWWDGQDWTQQYYTAAPPVAAPAGWYDDGSGRQRWWDGQDWTEHYQGSGPRAELPQEWLAALGGNYSNDLERGHDLPAISLSRAQWEERARVMFQERVISELQWRLLSNARIEGADSELLQFQAWLRTLTAEEFSHSIDRYVASQPDQALELATAGWYDDGSGRQHWWDGLEWTGYFQTDESKMLPAGRPSH